MVIDDELVAWVKRDYLTRFEKMPTRYGPVTRKLQLDPSGESLHVTWKPQFREASPAVVLHVPPVPGLRSIIINSTPHAAKPGDRVELSSPAPENAIKAGADQ